MKQVEFNDNLTNFQPQTGVSNSGELQFKVQHWINFHSALAWVGRQCEAWHHWLLVTTQTSVLLWLQGVSSDSVCRVSIGSQCSGAGAACILPPPWGTHLAVEVIGVDPVVARGRFPPIGQGPLAFDPLLLSLGLQARSAPWNTQWEGCTSSTGEQPGQGHRTHSQSLPVRHRDHGTQLTVTELKPRLQHCSPTLDYRPLLPCTGMWRWAGDLPLYTLQQTITHNPTNQLIRTRPSGMSLMLVSLN